jgi:hypothetical protein
MDCHSINYHHILTTKIHLMITNDLTIGRSDDGLPPFTSDEIHTFLEENHENIEKVIQTMIHEYSKDHELELLADPLLDWIGEYLYDFVDTNKERVK